MNIVIQYFAWESAFMCAEYSSDCAKYSDLVVF